MMAERNYYELQDKLGLYLVQTPPSDIPYTCDIFIVHGLNGGTAKTYVHPTTGAIWFQHFLHEDVKDPNLRTNARIWVYGYDADVAFQNAGNRTAFMYASDMLELVFNAHKPGHKIIWICHSLGGILVKTALVQSKYNDRYAAILQSTVGILFIGTPHQGTRAGNLADLTSNIAHAVTVGVYKPKLVIQGLKRNCNDLFERANNFSKVCGSMRIFGFYEARGILIVTEDSAATHLPHEILQSLDAPHGDLCKFRDRADPNYIKICNAIRELMQFTVTVQLPHSSWNNSPYSSTSGHDVYGTRASQPYSANTGRPMASAGYGRPTSRQTQPYTSQSSLDTHGELTYSPASSSSTSRAPATPTSSYLSPEPAARGRSQSQATTSTCDGYLSRDRSQEHSPFRSQVAAHRPVSSQQSSPPPIKPSTLQAVPPSPQSRLTSTTTASSQSTLSEPITPTIPLSQRDSNNEPWICDAHMGPIPNDSPRIHCLECGDYDLCAFCYQNNRISKTHLATHKVRRIKSSVVYGPDDFCHPSEQVNPYEAVGTSLPNWTICENEARWNHLRKNDSHDRYMVTSVAEGHYAVQLILRLQISDKLTAGLKKTLNGAPLGKLRIVAGFPKNKKDFLHKDYPENTSLKDSLFASSVQNTCDLPSNSDFITVDFTENVFTFDSTESHEIGILLQWTEMRGFKHCNDAIAQICLYQLRLEDLFEWMPNPSPPSNDEIEIESADDALAESLGRLYLTALVAGVEEQQRAEAARKQRLLEAQREQEAREAAAAAEVLLGSVLYINALQEAEEERQRKELLRRFFRRQ